MKTKIFAVALAATSWLMISAQAQVSVTTAMTNGLAEPYDVVTDDANNAYISDSVYNCILRVDGASGAATILAGLPDEDPGSEDGPVWVARFFNPQGLALATVGGVNGLLVSDTGNQTIRFVNLANGEVTTLAGQVGAIGNVSGGPAASRLNNPLGLAADDAGHVYIADSGNNAIRVLDLTTTNLETLAVSGTSFNQPADVAVGETNRLWVADTRNNMVKLLNLTSPVAGTLLTTLGSGDPGTKNAPSGAAAQFNNPRGLLWWKSQAQLLISDTGNHAIRIANSNGVYGANNFSVQTFAGVPGLNGFTNGPAYAALFDTPIGLAPDLDIDGFLIADLKNNAIRRIQSGPVRPPVATPLIGWVDFIWNDALSTYVTFLRTEDQPRTFNNDVQFAILRETGTDCHYTTANTPWPPGFVDVGEDPSKSAGSTPPEYFNGVPMSIFNLNPAVIEVERNAVLGGLVIKAIGFQNGRQNSTIAKANYAFKAGTPVIVGNNFASFKVYSITTNPVASVYYTLDGSDPTPTNTMVSSSSQLQLQFAEGQSHVTFRARAFAPNYLPSEIAEKTFSATNFLPTRICLGFTNGEVSTKFIASPGQTFYTPIALQLADGTTMFSLQFNLVVTNLATAPKVTGRLDFASMLYEQVGLEKGEKAPPGQGRWFRSIPPAMWFDSSDPTAPSDRLIVRDSDPAIPLMDLTFYDSAAGLIGVGWIERWLFKDLYDTTRQDLIQYSIARDNLFNKDGDRVVLGAGAFEVPTNATSNAQYQFTLGRPSATSDGVGASGSQVYIATPVTGYLTNGGYFSQRIITMGQEKYIVGDAAPFRWLNAGDFGDTNLLNDDVMQVFECSVYNLAPVNPASGFPSDPPFYSDLRDAMDAGPILGVTNSGTGCFVPAGPTASISALFDGNDTSINDIAFGDGVLDVADVYITFRRSLDPTLVWWRRFYTNGVRVAEMVSNGPPAPASNPVASSPRPEMSGEPSSSEATSVLFTAGDVVASGGQTVQVPIRARIQGNYPLRVLMLGLSIQPLDGSPAPEEPVQFTPVAALGQPTMTLAARDNGYSAAWLNSRIGGVTGDALLGTLSVKLPANAPASAAYAVHFSHASGSPNGLATFPQQIQSGLITLSDRSGSSLGDGIADAWRLRYFNSIHAVLASADADADGDGHPNRVEYKTGTNPNDSLSVLRLRSHRAMEANDAFAVRWPSAVGKRYVIERAGALFGTAWVPVSTNTGTGGEMEFADPDTSPSIRFYRVRVAE